MQVKARAGWWGVAVVAVTLGAGAGTLIANTLEPPASASSAPFASTGGIFTKGNGASAPGWALPGLADPARTVALREFHGRPTVVNFWASWCTPCRKEMPALEQARRLLQGQVAFVGLNTRDQRRAGLAFARKTGVSYPLATANARVWSAYGVSALPSTFFISAQGTIVGEDFGGLTRRSILRLVSRLFHITPGQAASRGP